MAVCTLGACSPTYFNNSRIASLSMWGSPSEIWKPTVIVSCMLVDCPQFFSTGHETHIWWTSEQSCKQSDHTWNVGTTLQGSPPRFSKPIIIMVWTWRGCLWLLLNMPDKQCSNNIWPILMGFGRWLNCFNNYGRLASEFLDVDCNANSNIVGSSLVSLNYDWERRYNNLVDAFDSTLTTMKLRWELHGEHNSILSSSP